MTPVILLGKKKSFSTSLLKIERFVVVERISVAIVGWLRKRYQRFGEKSKKLVPLKVS